MENRRLDPFVTCFVPSCKNTVSKCPDKHFFHVPRCSIAEWCSAVNRVNVPKSSTYICEDHLNLEEDIHNYEDWIKNRVKKPRLKPQVPNALRIKIFPTATPFLEPVGSGCEDKGVLCKPEQHSKLIQVNPAISHRSVSVNIKKRKLNYTIKETCPEEYIIPSSIGSTTEFSETESTRSVEVVNKFSGREFMLNLIEKYPSDYIGIAKQYFWIIDYLQKVCKIPSLHIILTFYKIMNNDTFKRMRDIFEVSLSTLWRMFYKTLEVLSLFFRQLLYWPSLIEIKRNLPQVFRCNPDYASVQCIIDAFEIEMEKPSKPINQSLTWSQYKHCNTVKYIIGITPDGFINFVSEGYGGRISDVYLVEQSGFLETVPQNSTILADRGFKHLESHLIEKNVRVLRRYVADYTYLGQLISFQNRQSKEIEHRIGKAWRKYWSLKFIMKSEISIKLKKAVFNTANSYLWNSDLELNNKTRRETEYLPKSNGEIYDWSQAIRQD